MEYLPLAHSNFKAKLDKLREVFSLFSEEYFPLNWCVIYDSTSFGQRDMAHVREHCAPLYQPDASPFQQE